MNTAVRVGLGVFLGLALGVAMLYGLVEVSDYIVEQTHDSYSHSIPDRR